ncbi:MAG: glycoside hydrolase family 5 protein [Anaerolineae bacterium]
MLLEFGLPFILGTGLLLAAVGCAMQQKPKVSTSAPRYPAATTGLALGRGVNLGNALEAPREGEWGVVLQEEYFDLIRNAGFDAVRIPIRWSAHALPTEPYTVDPAFFRRVDWAVEQALARGLRAVINMHHYEELVADPAGQRARFLALWRQIADHYRPYPADLLFELLNEPNGKLDADAWNDLLVAGLAVVRETNPTRAIIIGPANWNGIDALPRLKLPADDRHIIATVHYYNPFHFTHQGAEWVQGSDRWLGAQWQGSDAERAAVAQDLGRAAAWATANDRPLYLGEFGAYSKADMASRVRWTNYVARQAESLGMSWAYWEFCAGFGIYDPARRAWNEDLLRALVPPVQESRGRQQ